MHLFTLAVVYALFHVDNAENVQDASTKTECTEGAKSDTALSLVQKTQWEGKVSMSEEDMEVGGQPAAAKDGVKQPAAEIQELDARGRTKGSGNPTGVVVKDRDSCPCMTDIPQSLTPKWNISAEIPEGLEMKHAGWAEDYTDRGIGIFATKAFQKGDVVGGAHARVVPCMGAKVQTSMGTRSLNCEIHFFDLPTCSGGSVSADDEKLAIFPSWISFLNAPDEYDEAADKKGQNSRVRVNLEFGSSTCRSNPGEDSEWTLVASQDILQGNELTVLYDESELKGTRGKGMSVRRQKRKMMGMMKKMRGSKHRGPPPPPFRRRRYRGATAPPWRRRRRGGDEDWKLGRPECVCG